MKKSTLIRLLLITCCAVVAVVAFLLDLRSSSADHLNSELTKVVGKEGSVSLKSCNLSIIFETRGLPDKPIALTRVVLRADLKNYNLDTVRFLPFPDRFDLRINRGPVDDHMLAQVDSIVDAGDEMTELFGSDAEATKKLLEAEGSSLFFRVMAEVVVSEEGAQKLVAHDDAPEFFRFTEAVESIPIPTSYRTTTTFASGEASAETFLTGEVVAIPFLQFSVGSEYQAKTLARAFHEYAKAYNCN